MDRFSIIFVGPSEVYWRQFWPFRDILPFLAILDVFVYFVRFGLQINAQHFKDVYAGLTLRAEVLRQRYFNPIGIVCLSLLKGWLVARERCKKTDACTVGR